MLAELYITLKWTRKLVEKPPEHTSNNCDDNIYLLTNFWKNFGLFFHAMNTKYTGILVAIMRHPYPVTQEHTKFVKQ